MRAGSIELERHGRGAGRLKGGEVNCRQRVGMRCVSSTALNSLGRLMRVRLLMGERFRLQGLSSSTRCRSINEA